MLWRESAARFVKKQEETALKKGRGNQIVRMALGVLGYGPAEINLALKGVDTAALTTEEIIKAALKNMMKK